MHGGTWRWPLAAKQFTVHSRQLKAISQKLKANFYHNRTYRFRSHRHIDVALCGFVYVPYVNITSVLYVVKTDSCLFATRRCASATNLHYDFERS